MESSKVKLPKEVAEAIESLFKSGKSNYDILRYAYQDNYTRNQETDVISKFSYRSEDVELLMQALVNGYEVEHTPEDKVRELYLWREKEANEAKIDTSDRPYYNGICRGIKECLDALGIKIKGVNDHENN